jgi:hypothetical protein
MTVLKVRENRVASYTSSRSSNCMVP